MNRLSERAFVIVRAFAVGTGLMFLVLTGLNGFMSGDVGAGFLSFFIVALLLMLMDRWWWNGKL
jgi:hypothetical protein